MKASRLAALLLALFALVFVAACGSDDEGGGGTTASEGGSGLPKLEQKESYKVGFAQTESNNPWRLAQTASMREEAKKRGHQLVYTDAAGDTSKEVGEDRKSVVEGKRVDLGGRRIIKKKIHQAMLHRLCTLTLHYFHH